ncbi:signal peptidase I [Sphingomonas sp. ST-64]|uniref:Signal peptidase I n=1 Tax=Sphingomonas plantiphila TaxID=3163295 RepID=A0ABW8YS28_9SPHN
MKWWTVPAGIGGAVVLAVAAVGAITIARGDLERSMPWKFLRSASESMAPTVRSGVRLTARRASAEELKRGDIVAFYVGDMMWIQRVVGLPGDTVEMRRGQVVLNGKPVPQASVGTMEIDGATLVVRSEQLPGLAAHRVLDQGPTNGDDTPPVRVPASKLFLLGDNRDNAMDSRFPAFAEDSGGGLISFKAVYGVVRPEDISE